MKPDSISTDDRTYRLIRSPKNSNKLLQTAAEEYHLKLAAEELINNSNEKPPSSTKSEASTSSTDSTKSITPLRKPELFSFETIGEDQLGDIGPIQVCTSIKRTDSARFDLKLISTTPPVVSTPSPQRSLPRTLSEGLAAFTQVLFTPCIRAESPSL